jgi:hypothetical protein
LQGITQGVLSLVEVKEEREKVRREVTIPYKELANKFPQLPKNARVYGWHAWNKRGGWDTDEYMDIVITLDFEEKIK